MALRCMLGKLGNNNKFRCYKRRAMMLGTFEVIKHKNKELLSTAFPTHSSPLHFQDIEFRAPVHITTRKEGWYYHMELGLRPARFALEEFNKIKKAQLQLLRVVGLWMKPQGYTPRNPCHCLYVVIMEAVDPDGVALLYQAHIQLHDLNEGMWLEAFYRCCKLIGYQRLYHYLDNFYDSM